MLKTTKIKFSKKKHFIEVDDKKINIYGDNYNFYSTSLSFIKMRSLKFQLPPISTAMLMSEAVVFKKLGNSIKLLKLKNFDNYIVAVYEKYNEFRFLNLEEHVNIFTLNPKSDSIPTNYKEFLKNRNRKLKRTLDNQLSIDNFVKIKRTLENIRYNKSILILELDSSGIDLEKYLQIYGINELDLIQIFKQLTNILLQIHRQKMFHNNLTLYNIYIKNKKLFLLDLGKCKKVTTNINKIISTDSFYAAPEMFGDENYCSFKANIWALGICFFVMAKGYFPNEDINIKDDDKISVILRKMLHFNPEKRISIDDLKLFFEND